MQESAAKAAASLHHTGKGSLLQEGNVSNSQKKGIKRLLMDNSNPAEHLLPLGGPASTQWSTQGDGCCWLCGKVMGESLPTAEGHLPSFICHLPH